MKPLTEITPQQAADALGVDLYTLARFLRESARNEFERIAKYAGTSAHPRSATAREEIERPLRLLASAEECDAEHARLVHENGAR